MTHGRLKKGGTVLLVGACVLFLAGCGQKKANLQASVRSAKLDKPVSIFIPSWQNSFSPVNTWQNVAKSVEESLEKEGLEQGEISVKEVDSSQEVQDVERAEPGSIAVVFPAKEPGIARRQFGNLLAPLPSSDLSNAISSSKASFVTTLSGVRGSVSLPTMYEIGQMEASSLLKKIKNYSLSALAPFPLLILLPFTPDSQQSRQDAHELFNGMWSRLSSYFEKKLIYDPAWDGKNWENLMVDVATPNALQKDLKKIIDQARIAENSYLSSLGESASPALLPNIGAVLASNDFVASQVGGMLKNMGYQGTVADAGTSLSVGKEQEAKKQAPPAPSRSMGIEAQKLVAKALIKERKAQNWPILIGFGALLSSLQNVVNAREWSTGLVDRTALASAIADACLKEEKGGSPPPQSVPAVMVDENNFKQILIDTGFVSPDQAGL